MLMTWPKSLGSHMRTRSASTSTATSICPSRWSISAEAGLSSGFGPRSSAGRQSRSPTGAPARSAPIGVDQCSRCHSAAAFPGLRGQEKLQDHCFNGWLGPVKQTLAILRRAWMPVVKSQVPTKENDRGSRQPLSCRPGPEGAGKPAGREPQIPLEVAEGLFEHDATLVAQALATFVAGHGLGPGDRRIFLARGRHPQTPPELVDQHRLCCPSPGRIHGAGFNLVEPRECTRGQERRLLVAVPWRCYARVPAFRSRAQVRNARPWCR